MLCFLDDPQLKAQKPVLFTTDTKAKLHVVSTFRGKWAAGVNGTHRPQDKKQNYEKKLIQ